MTPALHPDIQRLSEANAELRAELAALLTEAHDLVHTVRPNLLAIYQTKLGAWELEKLKEATTMKSYTRAWGPAEPESFFSATPRTEIAQLAKSATPSTRTVEAWRTTEPLVGSSNTSAKSS